MRVVSDVGATVRAIAVGAPSDIGGLSGLMSGLDGSFELVGPVWPPAAVMGQVLVHTPELILVDYDPASLDIGDLIRHIRARFPAMKVIVLANATSADAVRDAVRAGAAAYLPRSCGPEEFTAAFHALREEQMVLGNEAARRLFGTDQTRTPLRRAELQVLRLLADGLTYDEITAQLEISRSTLKRHLTQIENKLHARNRVQAVAQAARQGLI